MGGHQLQLLVVRHGVGNLPRSPDQLVVGLEWPHGSHAREEARSALEETCEDCHEVSLGQAVRLEPEEGHRDPGGRLAQLEVEDMRRDGGTRLGHCYPPRMGDLLIRVGDLHFTARWEPDAPETVAAVRRLLPVSSQLIHCRWSGEGTWIPFGDLDVGVGYEHHTSHPAPAEMLI